VSIIKYIIEHRTRKFQDSFDLAVQQLEASGLSSLNMYTLHTVILTCIFTSI